MAQLSLVLFSNSPQLHAEFEEIAHVELTEWVRDANDLHGVVRRRSPDVLFVDLGEDPEGLLDVLDGIPAPRPLLLVAGPEDESRIILRAMRLGAREFLSPTPEPDALRAALERLAFEHHASPEVQKIAPVVAVMGSKGGVGATFAACQLAFELDRLSGRTVIVDLNLRVGDVSLYFDLQPRYTLANLATDRDRFDSAFLHTVLEVHHSGVNVLAAPQRAEDAELVKTSHLERVVNMLRGEFDWVLLDLSRSWDEMNVRALDLADETLLVTLMDVPTLNHTRKHLDLLQRLGHPADKIRLIANRYSKAAPVTDKDFVEFLSKGPDVRIPNNYPVALACVNEGKPLWEMAKGSSLHSAYSNLAAKTFDWCEVPRPPNDETPGWLNRMRGSLATGWLNRMRGSLARDSNR